MTDTQKPVRPRDVQEPLLTSDELNALMRQDLPTSLPQGFTSGVNAFFELMEKVADAQPPAANPFATPPKGSVPAATPSNAAPEKTTPADAVVAAPEQAPATAPAPTAAKQAAAEGAGKSARDGSSGKRPAVGRDDQAKAEPFADAMESPMAAELAPPGHHSAALAFGELLLLFGVAVAIELSLTGQLGSFGAHPHPYWLIVLPIAAARGLWTGLAAALLAATLHTLGAARALRIVELTQLLDHQVMREPILFGLAAFLVGQFRDDLLQRYRKLWRFMQHQSQETARIAADNRELRERNQSYQAKLLDHSAQFGNLIDVARRLEMADEHEIYKLALDMLEEHCGATRCSVLMVVARGEGDANDQLELVVEHGWPEPTIHLSLGAAARSPLLRKCVREATPVSGFDPATPPPKDGPILVAPVFDEHTVLAAVLCLEELPADRYSPDLESMFVAVAEWTTVSLARVRAGKRAQQFTPQAAAQTAEVWVGTAVELGDRIRLEDARCTQQGLSTSLITLQATELAKTDTATLAELDTRVRELATGSLRSSDSLFQFGYPGCWIAVLPDTPLSGAKVVCQRLARRLRMTDSGTLGAVAIDAIAPDDEHPSLRKLLAPLAERFRKLATTPLDSRCPVVVPERGEVGDAVAFVRRVRVELDLAMRSDYELFVVSLWLASEDARQRDIFAQQIEQQHGRLLRSVDAVFQLGVNHFALVLPDAAGAVAFTLVGELLEVLGARLSPEVVGSIQQEVFALSGMPGEAQRLIDRLVAQSHHRPAETMAEPPALAAADATPTPQQNELAKLFGGDPAEAPATEAQQLDAALAAALGAQKPQADAADAALRAALRDAEHAAHAAELAAALGAPAPQSTDSHAATTTEPSAAIAASETSFREAWANDRSDEPTDAPTFAAIDLPPAAPVAPTITCEDSPIVRRDDAASEFTADDEAVDSPAQPSIAQPSSAQPTSAQPTCDAVEFELAAHGDELAAPTSDEPPTPPPPAQTDVSAAPTDGDAPTPIAITDDPDDEPSAESDDPAPRASGASPAPRRKRRRPVANLTRRRRRWRR